jgi:hypothetical protein
MNFGKLELFWKRGLEIQKNLKDMPLVQHSLWYPANVRINSQ